MILKLDWYDVEARMKRICQTIIKPVADIASTTRSEQKRDQERLENMKLDTDKLV